MRRNTTYLLLLGGAVLSLAALSTGRTQQKADAPPVKGGDAAQAAQAAARDEIIANVRKYTDAFNKQDVQGVLKLFTEDCTVHENDGDRIHGLKELEEELTATFAGEPAARISVGVDSVTFVNADVALEAGKVTYFPDGKTLTAEAEYQVTHVRKGDRWLMSHVRAFQRKVLSPYDRLRALEWLVGDWVEESPSSAIASSYKWDANKAFLLQEFTVRVNGQKALHGTQRIGWDPLTKQIKAWIFDSEGGYGESLWSAVDDGWIIRVKGVRTDGQVVTMTNAIRQVAKDRMSFDSADRIVGEDRMPNIAAFAVRKAPAPKD